MTDRPHRIRGSLERHVGRTATDDETLHELAATAFRQRRAVVFLAAHLDAMPAMVRALRGPQPIATGPKRRFTEHTPAGNPYELAADHVAVVEGRTLFLARTAAPALMDRLLKGGENNRKIGGSVAKGHLRGAKVFTLSLEERATCPATCAHWRDCYGNVMNWPSRIQPDADLTPLLEAELRKLHAKHGRILIRLHVLGDFFSVEYVSFWRRMLELLPGLNVYGYTARTHHDHEIAERTEIGVSIGP